MPVRSNYHLPGKVFIWIHITDSVTQVATLFRINKVSTRILKIQFRLLAVLKINSGVCEV